MALVDRFDEPPREKLAAPTKEQINAITDIPALQAIRDEIEATSKKIEVDLEFEVGDDDWDARARSALAHFRVAITRIDQQIRRVQRGITTPEALAERQVKSAENHERQVELSAAKQARKIAVAEAAVKEAAHRRAIEAERAQRVRMDFAKSISFRGAFFRIAREKLDADVFAAICDEAQAIADERLLRMTRVPDALAVEAEQSA